MKCKLEFEVDLDDKDAMRLSKTMQCDRDNLDRKINDYAKAAFFEYTYMTTGDKVFTRFADQQEYRLFLLIKHFFCGRIPSDQEVSSLFHIPYTAARSLTKSMLSRYRNELDQTIEETAASILKSSQVDNEYDDKKRVLTITSANMVDELNDIIASLGSDKAPITKKRNTMSNYCLPNSSYELLCGYYNLSVD